MIATSRCHRQHGWRVRELTEKLIDDRIEAAELSELKELLTNSPEDRAAYIEAILLEADLHGLRNEPAGAIH